MQSSALDLQKPFEYVTLAGNVIRSVVAPGKGAPVHYKVRVLTSNQHLNKHSIINQFIIILII